MAADVTERSIGQVLDAIYQAALTPDAWPVVLDRLAALFNSHFADLFTRSHDCARYMGLAHGLERADYQDQFLDVWFKRNVWGLSKPVKAAGEVLSTRQMVEIDDLVQSEIFTDYLDPRGLHEGLRFAIWADDRGIQDISLLRSWSAGAFEAKDIELGSLLLPHLQRAATIARRLLYADAAARGGLAALEAAGFAVLLLDTLGNPVVMNDPAARIIRERDGLGLQGTDLSAATSTATQALRKALALGLQADILQRTASSVRLPRPSGKLPLVLVTIPLRGAAEWMSLAAPALLVLIADPDAQGPSATQLSGLFGLTDAEADLAGQLFRGADLREIARRRGSSVHTVRNHLARLMDKTETTRQAELVGLLRAIPAKPKLLGPGG